MTQNDVLRSYKLLILNLMGGDRVEAHSKIDGDCDFGLALLSVRCPVEAHSKIDGDCDCFALHCVG